MLARIEGVQKRSSDGLFSQSLEKLEQKLIKEYNDILLQEEIYWFQKSRVQWLQFGDRNTKYFHSTTLIRRRKKKY